MVFPNCSFGPHLKSSSQDGVRRKELLLLWSGLFCAITKLSIDFESQDSLTDIVLHSCVKIDTQIVKLNFSAFQDTCKILCRFIIQAFLKITLCKIFKYSQTKQCTAVCRKFHHLCKIACSNLLQEEEKIWETPAEKDNLEELDKVHGFHDIVS